MTMEDWATRVIQDRLFQSDFDRLVNGDDLLELPEADRNHQY